MDLEYDSKFEEMKKYIPFLESMIKRLESTGSASSNPRQAQLDKIKSLRDLLLDEKKRMKMENLLKCEQVLVNLYAKVEQRDALPGHPTPDLSYSNLNIKKEEPDLETARNKLKSVASTIVSDKETLPEISRASEIEEVCTAGSKEPALFQRRPNKSSISPSRGSGTSPNKFSVSKRNYTRVLVSPEPSSRPWNADNESKTETVLFSRRSPNRRTPKRYSPSRERKKERKKGSKQEKLKKSKGLNITLNVPEETLNSLNTEDILSRIMNCSDNDMDIETLREAKRQILSELNQTGAKYDDISDLLLKSYKTKGNKSQTKNNDDVEEGELSDSESEAIESIYGGLNSSQSTTGKTKKSDDKEKPRKIQICLVINPEDEKASETGKRSEPAIKPLQTDTSDFEMFREEDKNSERKIASDHKKDERKLSENLEIIGEVSKIEDANKEPETDSKEISNKPANFYKPLKEQQSDKLDPENKAIEIESESPEVLEITETNEKATNVKTTSSPQKSKDVYDVKSAKSQDSSDKTAPESEGVEIPLLHDKGPSLEKPKDSVVSEIDILQALKNEILSETISIPGSEVATPALHQPKLKKVANAQEIAPKKRISIEKYKEKSVLQPKTSTPLFIKSKHPKPPKDLKDDSKKQSLKLTMKECERFNFPTKLSLEEDDSSSDDDLVNMSLNDIYGDIDVAPKSPDLDDSSDVPCTPPIIIPVDPVKTSGVVAPTKQDIDMRTLQIPNTVSITSPAVSTHSSPSLSNEIKKQKDLVQPNIEKPKVPSDPRIRREQSASVSSPIMFPNVTPSRTPSMTPIRNPSMTPSMTPNARTFDIEEKRHVYAPIFTSCDPQERENSVAKDFNPYKPEMDNESRRKRWDPDRKWDERDPRSSSKHRDGTDYQKSRYSDTHKYNKSTRFSIDRRESVSRSECPLTPVHPFGHSDCPSTPNPYGIPSLLDVPVTPVHPFGRSDCPPTPSHPFGRSECPPTPIHPFGRSDCPTTPNHHFGRSDCPTTPSHPFGRAECPSTPSHSFGRGDMPMTPSHPFGRSENVPRDPRLHRSTDYDNFQKIDRERGGYRDYRDRNSSGYKPDLQHKSYDGSDSYRPYREKVDVRNDYRNERYNKYSARDRGGHFHRGESMPRREPSVGRGGRAVSREVDNERLYLRDRPYGNKSGHEFYNQNENSTSSQEFAPRRGFYRERSVGRSVPDERPYRSSSRGPSVGRTFGKPVETDNRLSVKPDAGRSFIIDTSVNSTFQDFLDGKKIQVFDYTFDNRRQRATSVGRSLTRESSVNRTLSHGSKQHFEKFKPTRRHDFKRASSVGRDIVGKEERSFKDIKADFERFKAKIETPVVPIKPTVSKKDERPVNVVSNKFVKKDDTLITEVGNRKSRKDTFELKKESSKKPYSPRKNNRDPRLRREATEGSGSKVDERNRKHVGIVYSHDNITRGTILGSGYGVKNYKIPKIKRPVEEKDEVVEKVESEKKSDADEQGVQKKITVSKTETGKTIDKKVVSQKKELETKVPAEKAEKNKNMSKNKKQTELTEKKSKEIKNSAKKKSVDTPLLQNIDIVENVEKRVTRLSRKSETLGQPVSYVKSRTRKAVIYDSDSDDENSKESNQTANITEKSKEVSAKNLKDLPNTIDENAFDSQSADQMDSSFGIDDLEMFSDNIVSDPVIDNINALIADLDNELGPTKIETPTDFSNDLIENMLDSITNAGKEDTKSLNEDEKLNDISEVINEDLNQFGASLEIKGHKSDKPINESAKNNLIENVSETAKNLETNKDIVGLTKEDKSLEKESLINIKQDKSKLVDEALLDQTSNNINNSDDVVTTTDIDKVQICDKLDDKKEDQSDLDGRSTPDSTINSNDITQNSLSQESVPDSTNEVQNETNSIVSSTHDTVETTIKDNTEPTSSNKDATSLNSIGSILDILQNKSKIKELLSLLGGQISDNDKIKKKLEKLSEIVSDEEDDETKEKEYTTEDTTDFENQTKEENMNKEIGRKNDITADTVNKEETKVFNEELVRKSRNEISDNSVQSDDNKEKVNENTAKDDENKEKYDKNKQTDVTKNVEAMKNEAVDNEENAPLEQIVSAKKVTVKRRKTRKFKKNQPNTAKRVTRSNFDRPKKTITKKKQSRELLKLQEDIKEMFMKDEILNATGIRMCRIAKLVDDKKDQKDDSGLKDPAPMVVIEKDTCIKALEETLLSNKPGKKKGKPGKKAKLSPEIEKKTFKAKPSKYKPGPKSKTKQVQKQDEDPYEFESDSVISDMMTDDTNDKSIDGKEDSSGSESESLTSSKSFGSSEILSDSKKKPKRKRCKWQSGVIKARSKKKKVETKSTETLLNDDIEIPKKSIIIPDFNCFTDKFYCFKKNVTTYSCRLCFYTGEDIVAHYKESHPHSEIPLSRMDPQIAKEAIQQCGEVNLQMIRNIPTDKYVCRFCYKEFLMKKKNILESFFWHIVSMHTGEYKKICSDCDNSTICPFNLDIPPPPKDVKGQLIGYICEKCNFTQISLENLKTHVISRHNDEQTEVYTINLAVMTRKTISTLLKKYNNTFKAVEPRSRILRSTRSNQSVTETSDDHSDDVTDSDQASERSAKSIKRVKKRLSSPPVDKILPLATPYQTKITYENDDSHSVASHADSVTTVKIERDTGDDKEETSQREKLPQGLASAACDDVPAPEEPVRTGASDDIFDYPHFKISYTDAGLKEYVCCINGTESHYKTTLLISMKKHVQIKHSEIWDGYCFVCKVIVTPQGQQHKFKECLQHFLDKHMDNFPVLEKPAEVDLPQEVNVEVPSKPYINVRPLSELISNEAEPVQTEVSILPKIESIVSLGTPTERVASPYPPLVTRPTESEPPLKYEEVQAEVMSKKHQVVLESMMRQEKLINVYKCAGKYCSFTSDSVEDALLHASTHNRVGGEGSLSCSYCNFDCSGNAIDLVMHVFKNHGSCPFVCGFCFYRSAAQQLVIAHISKMHPGRRPRVLSSTAAPPTAANEHTMLPRDAVVLYYVCPHACKYRTYTAPKFCEHLSQRHPGESWHSCYICSESVSSGMELIQHMKTHDLNVYQCTWCVHGADNETQLLAHTSAAHPDRQPQAYLRLITSKDGSKEFRVLPLASFNKSRLEVEKVSPASNKDNPVREAERSINLESLIGQTNQMIETAPEPAQGVVSESQQVDAPLEVPVEPPRLETPPMTVEEKSELPTPVLKAEPLDEDANFSRAKEDVVYCLDSDEEFSKQKTPASVRRVISSESERSTQNVIDLSEDETHDDPLDTTPHEGGISDSAMPDSPDSPEETQYQKMMFIKVLKCPTCFCIFKNVGGFKRHTNSCIKDLSAPVSCAHCKLVTNNRDELIFHYTLDHCATDMGTCGVCNAKFYSVATTRNHLKKVHRISKVVVSSKMVCNGKFVYTVFPMTGPKQPPKRKISGAGAEPPPKMKKYGPRDVDRLPINPILDELVHCALCEFNTKVRLNMVRHLQFHAEQQPVPHSAPINPVPHLETNEKHFDRMVNLASSSVVTRGPTAPTAPAAPTTVTRNISAEMAGKYPKLIPERQRYACGAKGCSYISVDEELFKCHWNTLHASEEWFRCVHCLLCVDTSKPASFNKIMEHIQMHDSSLFACSICSFHHYKKEAVKAHVELSHAGVARMVSVREEVESPGQSGLSAPTMDLKPWQCGLCEYKSLLRQEIIEHSGRNHQSKMQYKCSYCPFRTSTLENVTKHMTNSHPGKSHEVFYYFYREGTVPDEDGVPKWAKQRQRMGISDPEIKTESPESSTLAQLLSAPQKPIDLNIVKKEMEESLSVEALCQKYGQFCEPNGLNYKCPLCLVNEDRRDAMQAHLYEELGYRRWVCGTCSYKAFHSIGLNEHIISEHHGQNQSPVQLPPDVSIETWASSLLDHQTAEITKNKETLAKQKMLIERPPRPSKPEAPKAAEPKAKPTMAELEKAFGPLGVPNNMVYCCPKCSTKIRDEPSMRNHLESELTKIRWCCSNCNGTFQTYHEAQFHCKSAHAGQSARPREAERSPTLRAAWLDAVIQVQKLSMRCLPFSGAPAAPPPDLGEPDNSLLVVRYEERVPTPEEAVRQRLNAHNKDSSRAHSSHDAARPHSSHTADSDEERLVIDEPPPTAAIAKKTTTFTKCPHCEFQSRYPHVVAEHVYRHFNLKPYTCTLCNFTAYKAAIQNHMENVHGHDHRPDLVRKTELPTGPPLVINLTRTKKEDEAKLLVCLVCEKNFTEGESETHKHPITERQAIFAQKGKVVVRCSTCHTLWADVPYLRTHYAASHPGKSFNYVFHKLNDSKDIYCDYCDKRFSFLKDLRAHNAVHSPLPVKYTMSNGPPNRSTCIDLDEEETAKRKSHADLPPPKRIAKKSTTKLPHQTVAKKSTTKLPFFDCDDSDGEYSFYGTKPTPIAEYKNVTTLMSFCNTMVPFTLDKLSGVLDINPRINVEDVKKS